MRWGIRWAAYTQIYFDFHIIFWIFIYDIILWETEKTEVFEKRTLKRSSVKFQGKARPVQGTKIQNLHPSKRTQG